VIGDFLKPPTDNLYKFMCVSGLVMILFALTYPPWLLHKSIQAVYNLEKDVKLLELDVKEDTRVLEESRAAAETLHGEQQSLQKEMDALNKSLGPNPSTARLKKHIPEAKRAQKISEELISKADKQTQVADTLRQVNLDHIRKRIEIEARLHLQLWESRAGIALTVICGLFGIVGVFVFVKGFNAWSLRVQVYQDAILKKQAEREVGPIKNPPIPRNRFGFKGWR
jgi:cell division protein FtsB